ncbi:MAG: acetyl-CoA carboxylase biotin carboxyl carrier protein [Candidatus Kapabacteria bacterium]|nr:acetyl-CoA carboxylase biotin carboxyl carrier protein [Ignavibacteriota bacterium]MCW5883442.1 acetyl-CoA carboxylase biotin carboxyl carrier protein [Candidatus Kapabacteria bacterium]
MDLNYLRRLVKIFDDSKATHMDIEEDGVRISLALEQPDIHQTVASTQSYAAPQIAAPSIAPPTVQTSEQTQASSPAVDSNLHTIKSPIVGTFYCSPSPDAGSFVEVGSRVKPGDTLCIIEAMKLMNEIESDVAGIIEKILVENAKPVEFNQPIFVVRPE